MKNDTMQKYCQKQIAIAVTKISDLDVSPTLKKLRFTVDIVI